MPEPGPARGERKTAQEQIIESVARQLPRFTDLFDEESFYIATFLVVVCVVLAACIASRFIHIRDAGHVD